VRRVADFVLDREKQARTVDVEVEFTKPEDIKHLLAGYSADIEVILHVSPETLRVPTEAIIENTHLFVYQPDQRKIERRSITSGLSNWDFTEVRSGLAPKELVVINVGAAGIQDGAHATIIEEGP
jgi:HlyD family secretion protein